MSVLKQVGGKGLTTDGFNMLKILSLQRQKKVKRKNVL